jgi:hypothetical protein
MKIKSLTFLGLAFLSLAVTTTSLEAKVTGGSSKPSNPSVPNSSPTPSVTTTTEVTGGSNKPSTPSVPNSSPSVTTTTNSIQTTSKINNANISGNNQPSLQINSGAKPVTQPVNVSYKPQKVNSYIPSNTTLVTGTYKAPNPQNKPVVRRYVTRYDNTGRSYSLAIVVPIGVPVESYSSYYNNYFPSTVSVGYAAITPVSTTTVVDNTPTNGWDAIIFFVAFAGIIVVVIFSIAMRRG